jgi:hypothetical protein
MEKFRLVVPGLAEDWVSCGFIIRGLTLSSHGSDAEDAGPSRG